MQTILATKGRIANDLNPKYTKHIRSIKVELFKQWLGNIFGGFL